MYINQVDFEGFWVRRLVKGKGGIHFFNGSSARAILPKKIALLHFQTLQDKDQKIHASSRTFRSKIDSKGAELVLEEN